MNILALWKHCSQAIDVNLSVSSIIVTGQERADNEKYDEKEGGGG